MVSRAINKLMTSRDMSLYCTFSNDMTRQASTNQIGTFQVARSSRVSYELGMKSRTCLRYRLQQVGDKSVTSRTRDNSVKKNMSATSHVVSCCCNAHMVRLRLKSASKVRILWLYIIWNIVIIIIRRRTAKF